MALFADSNGVVTGKFTIPADVPAGTKRVHFEGNGSYADANFVGQGILETRVMQEQTTINTVLTPAPSPFSLDPLAQTFSLPTRTQLGGVDLFVTAKGTTPIIVQIRETQVGFPTRSIMGETMLAPDDITVNQWNRFEFPRPITILPDTEYALVVLCNDAVGELAIAELGKFDTSAAKWVTSQPYQIGVLLSSSNAATWTPHQDRDLAFRLLAANYTESERVLDLGTVPVSGATDLIVLAVVDKPSANATCDLELTMPDDSVVNASDGQVIRFTSATTGDIGVKARVKSADGLSGTLAPGMQIIAGQVSLTADYVTRAFDADAAGVDVRVIFDAIIPSGAGVDVYVSGVDEADDWVQMSQDGSAKALGNNVYEYQFVATNVEEARIRIKLELSGTVAARPLVSNLRVSTIESAP